MIYTVTLNPSLDKTVQVYDMTLGQVNRVSALRTDPGGKGINVSKTIKALGGESVAVALLAGNCGRQVAEGCEALGLSCDLTYTEGETRSNLKIVDPASHVTTDVNEQGPVVEPGTLSHILERLLDRLERDDIVIFAGSLPPNTPPELYRDWIRACQEKNAKVFLDADRDRLALAIEARPYLVKPNRRELEELLGISAGCMEELTEAARRLLDRGVRRVVVSLGAEGALFLEMGRCVMARGLRVEAGSTVGAGDAMMAALALSEDRGDDPEQTVRLAVAVSGASVMRSGTQAPRPEDVQYLLPRVEYEKWVF